MHLKLPESLSENIQTYLATYFAKSNLSQSFNIEINGCRIDLAFADDLLDVK